MYNYGFVHFVHFAHFRVSGIVLKLYTSSFAGVSGLRRQSIAKLHNLSIEAPITRVIALINSVQENAGTEVVQTLDKVCILLPKATCSTAVTAESEPVVGIFTKF